jgi:hypothetical protein
MKLNYGKIITVEGDTVIEDRFKHGTKYASYQHFEKRVLVTNKTEELAEYVKLANSYLKEYEVRVEPRADGGEGWYVVKIWRERLR